MRNNQSIEKQYTDLVSDKCISHGWIVNESVKSVMKSLLMARDKMIKGDKLIQSILNNDLKQSIVFCDYHVVRYLRELIFAKENFHIN